MRKKTTLVPGYLVRYADDFIIATDTRAHAEDWKARLQSFLQEKNEIDIIPRKNTDNRHQKEVHQILRLRVQNGSGEIPQRLHPKNDSRP